MRTLDARLKDFEAHLPTSEASTAAIQAWCAEHGIATPEPKEGETSNDWWTRVSGDAAVAMMRVISRE